MSDWESKDYNGASVVYTFLDDGARVLEGGSGKYGRMTKSIASKASAIVAVDPFGPVVPEGFTGEFVSLKGVLVPGAETTSVVFCENAEWWRSTTGQKAGVYGEKIKTSRVTGYGIFEKLTRYKIDTLVLDVEGDEYALLAHIALWIGGGNLPLLKTVIAEFHPYYADHWSRVNCYGSLVEVGMSTLHRSENEVNGNSYIVWG